MSVIAAIDVGSNAIRMAVGSVDINHRLVVVEDYREPIRLGKDVFSDGEISQETTELACGAFVRFKSIIDRHKVKSFRAVGTSALRETSNKNEFLSKIEKASGIRIEIIDGQEEARLVTLAVSDKLGLESGLVLLIDIGGGSIEITLLNDGDIVVCESVKMGAVRLLQILEGKKRGPKIFHRMVKDYAKGMKRQLKDELGDRVIERCAGTGGNIEALADLRKKLLKYDDAITLTDDNLNDLTERLQDLSYEERVSKLDLREDRADVIVPAAIVLQQILKETGIKKMLVPRVGLKEGVLLDLLPDLSRRSPQFHKKQVLAFARETGRRFRLEEDHAKLTARFATEIFDATTVLHGLGEEARLLLEVAAYLHDVGKVISINGHHRHSSYIIRSIPFAGLTERQKKIVATVTRYHRKAPPKNSDEEFKEYSADDRDVVRKLTAILRVADSLDKTHSGRLSKVEITLKSKELELALDGEGELLLERWALEKKGAYFEEVFDLRLKIRDA